MLNVGPVEWMQRVKPTADNRRETLFKQDHHWLLRLIPSVAASLSSIPNLTKGKHSTSHAGDGGREVGGMCEFSRAASGN
eukprot:7808077-Alexandrium_andersonii.AAC.1